MEETMERMNDDIIRQLAMDESVTGLLAVQGRPGFDAVIDGFDRLLLVVTRDAPAKNYIHHYIKDGEAIQERWISEDALRQWILFGENRNVIEWIMKGDILIDRNRFLETVRRRIVKFPRDMRTGKMLVEFSHFLRRFLQCKEYLNKGHHLDAYTNIMEALFHWARLSIIDQGAHPEVTVWEQVKTFNPGIYKLYEELIDSDESLEQRVRLVLLACDFNVMSKMAYWCELLIQVLQSRNAPFAATELKYHERLRPLHTDLTLVLRQLASRGIIREELMIVHPEDQTPQICYTAKSGDTVKP
jgi:hypothetical protein